MINSVNLSIVVPVFNSEGSLEMLAGKLQPILDATCKEYELILVNDGSQDQSADIAEKLAQLHQWVRAIDLMRNYGQHNALLCGIRQAKYEIIATMDDDLQNPPEELPRLLEELHKGFDVVYGFPAVEKHGFFRYLASRSIKLILQHAMGAATAGKVSSFRVFRTALRESFADYSGGAVFIDAMLTWGTSRFSAVPVRQDERLAGQSNYTLRKLIRHALNLITAFSTLPLQIASVLGFLLTVFGLALLAYVLLDFFRQGDVVRGFPFLASMISIFSGAQLFSLGVIGEYLARVHFRLSGRPAYVVKSTALEGIRTPQQR
jgi:undecaprenyl-phosphate 4-deoxy-4-formamido-L-arabinose transferase